jgi:cation transport ATPase
MRRDQALSRLPQIAAQITAWGQKARQAEKAKDMTAWNDAQRNISTTRRAMHRQLLATVLIIALALVSLAATAAWRLTGHPSWGWLSWGWLAIVSAVVACGLSGWLVTQPLPHERREARD